MRRHRFKTRRSRRGRRRLVNRLTHQVSPLSVSVCPLSPGVASIWLSSHHVSPLSISDLSPGVASVCLSSHQVSPPLQLVYAWWRLVGYVFCVLSPGVASVCVLSPDVASVCPLTRCRLCLSSHQVSPLSVLSPGVASVLSPGVASVAARLRVVASSRLRVLSVLSPGVASVCPLTRCRLCLAVLSHHVSPLSISDLSPGVASACLSSHQVSPLSGCPLTRCRLRCSSSTRGGVESATCSVCPLTRCRLCLSVLSPGVTSVCLSSHQVSPPLQLVYAWWRLVGYVFCLSSHQVSPLSVCPPTRCRLRCSSSTRGGV